MKKHTRTIRIAIIGFLYAIALTPCNKGKDGAKQAIKTYIQALLQ
jgi:hypothetical protein